MRPHQLTAPDVATVTLKLFGAYARWYMRRNLHAVRVSTRRPPKLQGVPVIVCMNHPSWWDPLVAMTLALKLFPERRHYAPIEAKSLSRYGFFDRIGFFGIEPGTAAGASRFLHVGAAILSDPRSMLWVTAQGAFTDPRSRPVRLQGGLGHLAQRTPNLAVLPVALEYPFWEERFPEALIRFGDPIATAGAQERSAAAWTDLFSRTLESTQDALALDAIKKNAAAFEVLQSGRAGVGGIYDAWRWARAKVQGHAFQRTHGAEHL